MKANNIVRLYKKQAGAVPKVTGFLDSPVPER